MAKIKSILNEAAKQAGDDEMTLHERDDYLGWLEDFCAWAFDMVMPEMFGSLVKQDSSISLSEDGSEATLPDDYVKALSVERDGTLCDIVEDPIRFQEVYGASAEYYKTSDDYPACTFWNGKLVVLPVGKAGGSTCAMIYLSTIGVDPDADIPFSSKMRPAAVAYVAGRAISAEADGEAVELGKAKLEEAGILIGAG